MNRPDSLELRRPNGPSRNVGGCEVLADPRTEERQAIFWSFDHSTDVVALSALSRAFAPRPPPRWPPIRSAQADEQERHIQFDSIPLQALFIDDAPLDAPMGILVPLDRDTPARLAAAETFWQA